MASVLLIIRDIHGTLFSGVVDGIPDGMPIPVPQVPPGMARCILCGAVGPSDDVRIVVCDECMMEAQS